MAMIGVYAQSTLVTHGVAVVVLAGERQYFVTAIGLPGLSLLLPFLAADWEPNAWQAVEDSSGGTSGSFVAQQLFASKDWKLQQQRKARIATGGRCAGRGLLIMAAHCHALVVVL